MDELDAKVDVEVDNLHVQRIGIDDLVGYVYIVRVDYNTIPWLIEKLPRPSIAQTGPRFRSVSLLRRERKGGGNRRRRQWSAGGVT
jgi:hypothetical protein